MTFKHRNFFTWHIWLGWLIGVPLILWTASGLFMVVRPIEEVRGEHLRAEAQDKAMAYENIIMFVNNGDAVKNARLISQGGSMVWIVRYAGGATARYDAVTGKAMARINKDAARLAADNLYKPAEKIESVRYFSAKNSPADLRREKASWQVQFADGTNVYIDALTGETLAVRTRLWRAFDFMWGLHIMDLQTREDTHHPILIGSAILALFGSILGFVMLFTRRRKRRGDRAIA